MATQSQRNTINTALATAGADYAAKAAEALDAWIELRAHDMALESMLMAELRQSPAPGFSEPISVPRHPQYLPNDPRPGLAARVTSRMQTLTAALTGAPARVSLVAARATAGSDYATKAAALVTAWAELAAAEVATSSVYMSEDLRSLGLWAPLSLAPNSVGPSGFSPPGTGTGGRHSFGAAPQAMNLRHATYYPNPTTDAAAAALLTTRTRAQMATLGA